MPHSNLSENETRLVKIFQNVLKINPQEYYNYENKSIDIERSQLEKWDSLAHAEIILNVESEFGISFNVDDFDLITSYNSLLQMISKYL